jgi:predicted RNA binding protein YcfA (HicA-like mRNA interferase family)
MGVLSPVIRREIAKIRAKRGYMFDRQRGSHIILRSDKPPFRRLTIPDHKTVAPGTLRAILKQAGLTLKEFLEMLG